MNVFQTSGGYRVIVTKPNGSKIFDFAFSAAHAWELARQHAGEEFSRRCDTECGYSGSINMMTGDVRI
jgi:hypothetical protein